VAVLLIGLLWLSSAPAPPAAAQPAERKVALVIGNESYPGAPLRNPVNDARAMTAVLRRLGFDVVARENATQKEMQRAIVDFGRRLGTGGVALFYYSGHGMQVRGNNYLVPVDAAIDSEAAVRAETVDVEVVLDQMLAATSTVNVVILDACRNNPFERRFRGTGRGLATMSAPKGTLVAYATAPGKVASDGDGENGLYTAELLRALPVPGLRIEDVFKRVRAAVAARTRDEQIPWEASSLTGDLFLAPTGAGDREPPADAGGAPPPAAPPPSVAIRAEPSPPVAGSFTKPPQSTRELKGKQLPYSLWFNASKWSVKATPGNKLADYELNHVGGAGFASVVAERIVVPLELMARAALGNFKKAFPDTRMIREERRLVNGAEVAYARMEGTVNGFPAVIHAYFHTTPKGSIQIITYTATALFDQYRPDFDDFLNGYVSN
jgi:hypothetical protein